MQTVEWGHCSHRDYMQQPFFSTGFQLSSFFIPKAQPLSVELRSRKFYHFSGWILGLFHFLPSPPPIISCTMVSWWRSGLTERRLSQAHFPSFLTSSRQGWESTAEDTPRQWGRREGETAKGRGQTPPPPPRILRSRGNTARPRWREASRESMRFDGKQFERRTEWQELATRLMACCPRAPTPPMNASVRYQS